MVKDLIKIRKPNSITYTIKVVLFHIHGKTNFFFTINVD